MGSTLWKLQSGVEKGWRSLGLHLHQSWASLRCINPYSAKHCRLPPESTAQSGDCFENQLCFPMSPSSPVPTLIPASTFHARTCLSSSHLPVTSWLTLKDAKLLLVHSSLKMFTPAPWKQNSNSCRSTNPSPWVSNLPPHQSHLGVVTIFLSKSYFSSILLAPN